MIELVDEFKEGQGAYNPPLQRGATEGAAAPTADAVGAVNPIEKLLFPEARRIFSGIYGHFLASAGSSSKVVLVCSASSGEGATTVAAGLAIAAAEKRASQVLLIDGNCHTPKASEAFGLADRKGLSDVLGGSLESSLCVSRTNISNLSLIGVGITPGNHIQALEAPKFRALVDKLAGAFQFVLVDGPPINTYPESLLYASQVDRVLMVIHAGVSRGPVVAKALSTLSAAGCDKVEVVLNRRTFAIPQRLYRKL